MLRKRVFSVFGMIALLSLVCGIFSPSAQAQTNITTERNDNARTGANLNETLLSVSNVNSTTFGKLFSYSVDGSVQAQPLYVSGLTIPSQGTHNVVYVATMNDVLYALDADSSSTNGGVLWSRDFRNPGAGITPIPISDIVSSNNLNIVGNVGIESTPVIDLSTNTLYLVARTKEVSGNITSYVARLHAIDITTGSEKFGGPTLIQGSVSGTGNGSSAGILNFDPKIQNQRSSLVLANGLILLAWASHEDLFAWHGWIFAYNSQTLKQSSVFCPSPNGVESGIWMAGRAPVIDSNNNVYYETGNGDYNPGAGDYGDSVLKLSTAAGTLSVTDWFTPDDFQSLQSADLDLGSTGPIMIPGTDLLVASGKESIVYVMHVSNMGHEQTGNNQIVQHFSTTGGQIKGGLAFWNRTTGAGPTMYVWPDNISLQAYQFTGSTFNTNPISQSTILAPSGNSGGVLSISANGSTAGTGIIWSSMPLADDADHGVHQGVLRAFDADNLTTELWDSQMNATRDDTGLWPKYSPPTVANGKVYMASFSNVLNVYGLFSQSPNFGISANPGVQSVSVGASTTYTVSTTQLGGFAGSIGLTVSGLPNGASASFSPVSIGAPGTSTLTVSTTAATPVGTYNLTITGTSGTLTNGTSVFLNVATSNQSSGVISIDFAGQGTSMAASEIAGVVAKANWNNAFGVSSTSALPLLDENGNATSAVITWRSNNVWQLSLADQPGNIRMMKGYLDTSSTSVTSIVVTGLPANSSGYNVYVYADGDNGGATRVGTYQISGTGILTTSITATDAANTSFSGTFTQANNSNGNYVVFPINAAGFTLTATPGTASDGTPRAPLNAIQIVPLGQQTSSPDFNLSATPVSASVTQGSGTSYSINTASLNGFSGTVNLTISGLPTGASGSFSPPSVAAGAGSTLMIATSAGTPTGNSVITITGISGTLTHTATVTLNVSSSTASSGKVMSVKFVGTGAVMAATEVAGVIAKSNWTQAVGGTPTSPLAILDETGANSGATVSWRSDSLFNLGITDQAGNARMMRGYLDDKLGNATTVTVAGLPSNSSGYNVYVYADGSNGSGTRTGKYQISGVGITTTNLSLTDPIGTDFSGTFTQANSSSGNYLIFTINASGFTLTATPGAASDSVPRAPVNAIQIVPLGPPIPDFTLTGSPTSASVVQGSSTTYTVSAGALNGFNGAINLSATGLPTGATASFNPASIAAGATSTLTVSTSTNTPVGAPSLTIIGSSGTLSHTASVTLNVTGSPDFSLSASPTTASVGQGGSTSYTISAVAVNSFAGSVGLAITGLPTGATASFAPASIAPGTPSTLTINTSSTTPISSSILTMTGTSGLLTHTASVTLNVTGAPDFSITASPTSASAGQGSSTSYTVSSAVMNSFSGTVNLSVSGLPTGVSGSFNPASMPAGGSSILTIATSANTPLGTSTLTITGVSGALTHTASVSLTVTSGGSSGAKVISIDFTGRGTPMAATEVAGVIAKSNWNQANGASSTSALALNDETGAATTATASWKADGVWSLPIVDQSGNVRLMEGYLDTGSGNSTTVTVSGLASNTNGYNVYVYADGDNGSATRSGTYQITGAGITTSSIGLTDPANTNFGGTFSQANTSNGNYVVFSINATGFTLTATPGSASDGTRRAPLNGVQIVPLGAATPDFTISATPATASVVQGSSAGYTVAVGSLSGFDGSVNLTVSGLPTGATSSFSPAAIGPGSSSTLTVNTDVTSPANTATLTITGTSGTITHTTTVSLAVAPAGGGTGKVISVDFVGLGTQMAPTEIAGAIAKGNWNQAIGASSFSPLSLVDETGSATGAAISWHATGTWGLFIADQPGSVRMMEGYLDTGNGTSATTVTVSGLSPNVNGYNVYVYADGDNGSASRSATYQISGTGVTTTSIGLTDAASTNFNGTFTPANDSNGNYVLFTVTATSFTISATAGQSSDGLQRAVINGIQIVPR